MVPDVSDGVWHAAVEAAERAFWGAGVGAGHGDHRLWTSGTSRRLRRARVTTAGVAGGVRVEVEEVRPRPRPWVLAVALVCVPSAVVVAVVLLSRASSLAEWAVVGALVAVPGVVAVWAAAVEWARSLAVLRRVRAVLAAVERAAWDERAVWVEAQEVDAHGTSDAPPEPDALPQDVGPAEWLGLDEIEGLLGARPARVAPVDLRRSRRAVGRATAERRDPVPEGFSEWRPDPRPAASGRPARRDP